MTISNAKSDFTGCETITRTLSILRELGACHQFYSFYTSLDRVKEMLNGDVHRLWLTRINSKLFDDLIEYQKYGTKAEQDRVFIKCFSYGLQESAGMWGLYCPTTYKAIRVSIPKAAMDELVKSECFDIRAGKNSNVRRKTVSKSISDVVYAAVKNEDSDDDRSNVLYWDGIYTKTIAKLSDRKCCKQTAGLMKDIEWSFENEARLIVKTAKCCPNDHIGINLPKSAISTMRFTLSPWANDDEELFVRNCLVKWLAAAGRRNLASEDAYTFRPSVLKGALKAWAKQCGVE